MSDENHAAEVRRKAEKDANEILRALNCDPQEEYRVYVNPQFPPEDNPANAEIFLTVEFVGNVRRGIATPERISVAEYEKHGKASLQLAVARAWRDRPTKRA